MLLFFFSSGKFNIIRYGMKIFYIGIMWAAYKIVVSYKANRAHLLIGFNIHDFRHDIMKHEDRFVKKNGSGRII